MKYKFRAECELDFRNLLSLFYNEPEHHISAIKINGKAMPDIEVELMTPLPLNELRNMMREVEDGHVMLQTVQPIERYTGERDYDLS